MAAPLGRFVGRGDMRMNCQAGVWGLLPSPRSAWPLPEPEAAAPSLGVSLGSCHLPGDHVFGDASSLLGWRTGTGAGPSLLGWSGRQGGVRFPRGCTPCGWVLHPSTVLWGLGWVFIIAEEKYPHRVPWHVAVAHPLPGDGRCMPGARVLRWAVAPCLPRDPPTKRRRSPGIQRRRSRQLPAMPSPQPVNSAAWPQGAGSN